MKKITGLFIIALFMIIINLEVKAEESLNKGQAITLVQNTFQAQVSLSEKPRTIEEIFSILSPYVTSDFRQSFLEANLVYTDGKYQTYGSDFAPYYIPFFKYEENTKFTLTGDKGYIYEDFPANGDGPVRYQEGVRGVELLLTDEGWKVHKILSPDEMRPIIETLTNKVKDIPNFNFESIYLTVHAPAIVPSVYFVPLYYTSLLLSHISVGYL
ncbi:uncharacterized protein DUF3993 [Bacillus oleivorans]|uniref:Uncharacterized protein DUF3993 n=1 Tax=Bacillus oleivorans TaxID=1448271 RepID=A0A285D266_9BACI|nr:DUF3993 domain-containing protein [Bacillus oleivorans]SNX73901.1 uncharacterized protein DUF3993 [Bacillus oleivorans]